MIHLFVDGDAWRVLAQRQFHKTGAERRNWVVDVVSLPVTHVVEFDTQKELYSVKESTRDDRGNWKEHEDGVSISDASIADADNTSDLLEMIRDDSTEHKAVILGFLLARQAENFLHEINFWDLNEVPDEKTGGVYITAEGESLTAKVVYGKERPDMMCVPYKVHLRDIGYVVEPGEPEMGRPYHDEFMDKLLGRN